MEQTKLWSSVQAALGGPRSPSPEHKVWPSDAGRGWAGRPGVSGAAFIPLTCMGTGERGADEAHFIVYIF